MMRLLCLGDIAISVDDKQAIQWSTPLENSPGIDSRIIFNFELPMGNRTNPIPRSSGARILADMDSLQVIQRWSPGFATLATNHILDGGDEGLIYTIESLNLAGFSTIGAGRTKDAIEQPMFWETKEGRLAIVNWVFSETHPDWMCVPGSNCWPGIEEATRIIRSLKENANWILVIVHWSDEDFSFPRPEDRKTALELVNIGADLIIGHHPHVIRGMETIKDSPVFYSLGNFYFSNIRDDTGGWVSRQAPRNREALGVELIFRKGYRPQYRFHSFWQTRQGFRSDPFHRAARRIRSVSNPLLKFQGSSYIPWYIRQRRLFDKLGIRFHFRLWNLGPIGLIRFATKKLRISG